MANVGRVLPHGRSVRSPIDRSALATSASTYGWVVYALVGLLGLCVYFSLLLEQQQDLAYDLYGLGAVAAILVGVRVYRPARRGAWLTLALGVALEAAGDLTLSWLTVITGSEPFPSVADAFYLAGYGVLAVGLLGLIERDERPRDQVAWVDALIIAGAASVVLWTLVFDQYFDDPTLSPPVLLVSVAYPFMDLVLLAVVSHVLMVSRRGQLGLTLLACGFLANLVADTWYTFLCIDGTYAVGQLVDAGWLLGYVAFGMAALHPSMRRAGELPDAERAGRAGLSRKRLVLVAGGALVAPAAALSALARGNELDVPAVLVGSGLLYLLVVYRVVLSTREQGRLTEDRARLAQALEQAPDMVWLTDASGVIQYVNSAFERMSGHAAGETVGRSVNDVLRPDLTGEVYAEIDAALAQREPWAGHVLERRRNGTLLEVDLRMSPICDPRGRVTGWTNVARDMTRERALEADLALGANVREVLEKTLRAFPSESSLEVAAQAVCDAIATLPKLDAIAIEAFEGDDDVVMVAICAGSGFPVAAAARLPASRARHVRKLAERGAWAEYWDPRAEDGGWSQAIAEAGIRAVAFAPIMHGDHVDGVLVVGTSDAAFAPTLVERLPSVADFTTAPSALLAERLHRHRLRLERRKELESVIGERAFRPVFQPIVELGSREIVGFEALTRFDSGQSPDLCFADASEMGLGGQLELATLEASLEQARALPAGRWLDLNVSARVLEDPGPLNRLLRGVDRPIVLEITEHEVIPDYGAVREALRSVGSNVRLAVDDAGAGIANFSHIVELRPDFVKMDISLVRRVNVDLGRQALVVAMRHFGRTAGCRLVAEGIETEIEAQTLAGLGVEFGQGYLFGRPEPVQRWATARSTGEDARHPVLRTVPEARTMASPAPLPLDRRAGRGNRPAGDRHGFGPRDDITPAAFDDEAVG